MLPEKCYPIIVEYMKLERKTQKLLNAWEAAVGREKEKLAATLSAAEKEQSDYLNEHLNCLTAKSK